MFRACFGKKRMPLKDAHNLSHCAYVDSTARPGGDGICQPAPLGPTERNQASENIPNQLHQVPKSSASVASARPSDSASGVRTRVDAIRPISMDAENVIVCDAESIMEGLCLKQHELGRGADGIVVTGVYRGVSCAVKVMLSAGLERAALRELLLAPSLVHPNIVSTMTTRATHLTDAFFDFLEGDSASDQCSNQPRTLDAPPIKSGDGFGDPQGLNDGIDPFIVLHQILHALGAETGKMVVIVVQEYCNSGNLDNAIYKEIFKPSAMWGLRLARRTLLRTAGEIARGFLHLHASGIVHGDLKPANILLHSSKVDRRGFVAKLADFGLSHVLPDAALVMHTKTWGSVAYMAPEAFSGEVSRATDVWSFGVMLWEMMCCERPYRGLTQKDVLKGLRENSLQLVWPVDAPMSASIIELGRRCLNYNPELRPTFEEIVEGLVAIERAVRAEAIAVVPEAAVEAAAVVPCTQPSALDSDGLVKSLVVM